MDLMQTLRERAAAKPMRVAFPEGENETMMQAVAKIAAEHLADYCRKRFLMAILCRKEEIGMAVLAELLRVVCILILILFATAT